MDRGRSCVKLVISNDHEGPGAARRAILGSVPWQRCQFHFQQNADPYVRKQAIRIELAADIRSISNSPDRMTAEEFLEPAIQKYAVSELRLSAKLKENLSGRSMACSG